MRTDYYIETHKRFHYIYPMCKWHCQVTKMNFIFKKLGWEDEINMRLDKLEVYIHVPQ